MSELPRSFSHSSASTFKQCPRRWKHKYIDKLPDPTGEAALVGQFAHDVLEQLCKEESALRTETKAKEIAGSIWPKVAERKDFKNLKLNSNEQREFRWKSWNAIKGLWDLEDPSMISVEATEQRVSTSLSGVPFFGIIDRLDRDEDGLVVVDYKTGKLPRYGDDNFNQVLLYAAAVASKTGEQPARARLLYLGKKTMETEVSADLVGKVVKDLSDAWSKLKSNLNNDEFEPITTPLCGWCSFIAKCPAGTEFIKKRASSGKLRSDAPARSALGL
jgi:putative RecB family exonuclease